MHPEISPLRCASVEMTKERAVLPARLVAEQERREGTCAFSMPRPLPWIITTLPFVIPDRSVPGFPTSRCWQRPRVRCSLKNPHDVDQRHGFSAGNPGERSGEICGFFFRCSRTLFSPRVFDEGLDSPGIFPARLAFDSADDVDPPGLQDLNCLLHVFWSQAASRNQPQIWRGPL
jgi:hypothetical protein